MILSGIRSVPFNKMHLLLICQFSPQPIYADWFQYFQNENARLQKETIRLRICRYILSRIQTAIYILNVIGDWLVHAVIGHGDEYKGSCRRS